MVTRGGKDQYWIVAPAPTADPKVPRYPTEDQAFDELVNRWWRDGPQVWRIDETSFGGSARNVTTDRLSGGLFCMVLVIYGPDGDEAGRRYYGPSDEGQAVDDFDEMKKRQSRAVLYRVSSEVVGRSRMPRYREGWDDQD